jgi:hypothetical protein
MKLLRVKSLLRKIYNYSVTIYKKPFCEEIIVLGDSHVNVFKAKTIISCFHSYFINVVCVSGATVSGLENPRSKTQALPIFMNRIKNSKAKTAIVMLGEVDTGFVIWYRADKYKTPVSEMLEKALINYQKLLTTLSRTFRVICISTPLPTIKDGLYWGEVANARKDIKATQLQRTRLTIQFNKRMQDFCKKNGISYLSFDEESIGEDGLVDSRLINSNSADHHYKRDVYAEMIINKLKKAVEEVDTADSTLTV